MDSEQHSRRWIVLVPTGSLGAGVREEEILYGISRGAQVIASDAGSTDSGAAYLAKGMSKNNRGAVKRDLTILMKAAAEAKIPILIGTSGQAGGNLNVDWTRDIAVEVARELGIRPRIALLYSEQSREAVKAKNKAGRIRPLPPCGDLADETIDSCEHIVAVMGPEPYIAALQAGADIILGGRTTDTAVIAAFALMKGAPPGASWHAGKIGECGAQCTEKEIPGSGVLLRIDESGFEVEPLNAVNRCTPHSVSAHMLYENSNPFHLIEPGGVLDVTEADYVQTEFRTVRVTSSVWREKPYTMKLEGAASGRFQTIMLVGIQDPIVLRDLEGFERRMLEGLYDRVKKTMGLAPDDFHISLRLYGWNAVSGERVPAGTPAPREVGVLFVATAATQDTATQIAKACNPFFFHMPMPGHHEMPSYGFAFTPADIERGAVYEFKLNHVVDVDDPMELVRTEWIDMNSERAS
ncbi:MAG TPA: acyclic terpene utilization AtuA family protein [Steroidobacter sp.]|uniref:acyclic terpene utilization AtuA family protein n=1 Tax=Steroidobacter sp. TaxID=1978227 RepID=UPI002EDAAEFD